MGSWKTTSAGIASIASGVIGFTFGMRNHNLTAETTTAYITAALTGVGLLFARDNNVSSVDLGLQTVEKKSEATKVVTPTPQP